jgi:biotin carboxyl carrier protein
MYKIKVNNQKEYAVEGGKNPAINGNALNWDIVEVKDGRFHIIKDNKSFNAEVIEANFAEKTFQLKVNNNKYSVVVKDRFDELLKQLGMDNIASAKVNEIKAPMPGLVIDIRVSEGDVIKKGDAVLVLEAMKMENILKSPTDGVVKKVNVEKGIAVEKNQILVQFA